MTNHIAALMAIAVAFGSWLPAALPLWFGLLWSALALCTRRHLLLVGGLMVLASAHSNQQWVRLNEPLPRTAEGIATLTSDPEISGHSAVRSIVKLNGRHYELWAGNDLADALKPLSAGDRVATKGIVHELSGKRASGLRRKHVAGSITATSLRIVEVRSTATTVTNGMRQIIDDGSGPLSSENKALYTGLLYGDDRNQTEQATEEFRDSGLAHLTAVSGANVAFVLLLLTPLFKRFSLFGRFAGGLVTLLVFGALTRWEPSVVRAEAMAAIVLYASFIGRHVSLLRCISLATTAILLIDPFLIGSLGFLLSEVACIGMALLGNAIGKLLPGALTFRRALAYSAAAQIAIAPLQLMMFGKLPLVGLVTNMLADPVAGLVMMWGLVAGMLAGALGGWWAAVLHAPTAIMLEWIRLVAHFGALADRDPVARMVVFAVPLLALASWKRRTSAMNTELSQAATNLD